MKNIKFKLKDIKLLRSEVRDHHIVFSDKFKLEDIKIEAESKFSYSDNYLQIFMHFQFDIKESEKSISLGHFDIIYTFEVDELKGVMEDEEAKKLLHLNIISLAYSTSRGILYSETKGYALNDVYLSPISPNKIYKSIIKELSTEDDLSIAIDKKQ